MHRRQRFIAIGPALLLLLAGCGAASPPSQRQSADATATQTFVPTVAAQPAPILAAQAAVTTSPKPYPTEIVTAVANDAQVVQLVAGLQQRGLTVTPSEVSRIELLQDAPGQAYRLHFLPMQEMSRHTYQLEALYLHLYPDAQAAARVAAKIPNYFKNSMLDWIGPPHFFQCDRLIALYLGAHEPMIAALSELCAPPFYTTELHASMPAPTEAPRTTIDAALAAVIGQALTTPVIRKQVTLESGVALLYTYEMQQNEQRVAVTRFSYLDWRDPEWYPDGDQAVIQLPDTPLPPLQLLTGTFVINGGADTPQKPDSVTFAGGLVNDSTIRQVRVIFSDGSHQLVPVEQGAYLAAKLDVERALRIEALDYAGRLVYQQSVR